MTQDMTTVIKGLTQAGMTAEDIGIIVSTMTQATKNDRAVLEDANPVLIEKPIVGDPVIAKWSNEQIRPNVQDALRGLSTLDMAILQYATKSRTSSDVEDFLVHNYRVKHDVRKILDSTRAMATDKYPTVEENVAVKMYLLY